MSIIGSLLSDEWCTRRHINGTSFQDVCGCCDIPRTVSATYRFTLPPDTNAYYCWNCSSIDCNNPRCIPPIIPAGQRPPLSHRSNVALCGVCDDIVLKLREKFGLN